QPSENTREHHVEVEHENVEPQNEIVSIHRDAKIPQEPDRCGFYVGAEEHELGEHNESANHKDALSDPKTGKWLKAMNAEMQSIKYN
ncbi:hypothetical protein Tco_0467402, partial [Tanacetum coccineum]